MLGKDIRKGPVQTRRENQTITQYNGFKFKTHVSLLLYRYTTYNALSSPFLQIQITAHIYLYIYIYIYVYIFLYIFLLRVRLLRLCKRLAFNSSRAIRPSVQSVVSTVSADLPRTRRRAPSRWLLSSSPSKRRTASTRSTPSPRADRNAP